MEKEQSIENSGFMPQKGNPTQETVTYKIGGTFYEVVYLLRRLGAAL